MADKCYSIWLEKGGKNYENLILKHFSHMSAKYIFYDSYSAKNGTILQLKANLTGYNACACARAANWEKCYQMGSLQSCKK